MGGELVFSLQSPLHPLFKIQHRCPADQLPKIVHSNLVTRSQCLSVDNEWEEKMRYTSVPEVLPIFTTAVPTHALAQANFEKVGLEKVLPSRELQTRDPVLGSISTKCPELVALW